MRTALLALVFLLVPAEAFALQQPNGTSIPTAPGCASGQPTGLLATFACACSQPGVCNIGPPCPSATTCDDGKHGTCESTMWHAFNDNTCIPSQSSGLDPVADAALTPETFHPTCALTFTVLSRGTAKFQNAFGWYNVTSGPPAAADLHPMLTCGDGATTSAVLDISKEPAYKGGDIGFFIVTPESHESGATCAGGDCCATVPRLSGNEGYVYYSERKYNPDQAGASSFIHLLIYDSQLVTKKFYFAWEDTFNGSNGDFTDLVTSVEGVECAGGGAQCTTGKLGVCALGVSKCDKGIVGCEGVVQPTPEVCDGLDDDCDGVVDNGATCPSAGDVCQNGKCVPHCGTAEFRCAGTTQCDPSTGLCVDPSCIGVMCSAEKVCQGGTCVAACDGVVCPHGQTCVGNSCVDLCQGVGCATGQVCSEGQCFAACNACNGLACAASLACDAQSGGCVDPSCATPCAAGTVCSMGACVDACTGVTCPSGQTCMGGRCAGPAVGGADSGWISPLGGGGVANAYDGGASDGSAANDSFVDERPPGCACELGPSQNPGGAAGALALCGLGIALAARRRRTGTE